MTTQRVEVDDLEEVLGNLPTLPINPTFKFAIGQEVWVLKDNKVHRGFVRVRRIQENSVCGIPVEFIRGVPHQFVISKYNNRNTKKKIIMEVRNFD